MYVCKKYTRRSWHAERPNPKPKALKHLVLRECCMSSTSFLFVQFLTSHENSDHLKTRRFSLVRASLLVFRKAAACRLESKNGLDTTDFQAPPRGGAVGAGLQSK